MFRRVSLRWSSVISGPYFYWMAPRWGLHWYFERSEKSDFHPSKPLSSRAKRGNCMAERSEGTGEDAGLIDVGHKTYMACYKSRQDHSAVGRPNPDDQATFTRISSAARNLKMGSSAHRLPDNNHIFSFAELALLQLQVTKVAGIHERLH